MHSTALHNRRTSQPHLAIPASLLDPNVDPVPRGTFNPHKDQQDLDDARFDEMDEEMGVGMSSTGSIVGTPGGGAAFGGGGSLSGGGGGQQGEGIAGGYEGEDGMMQHDQHGGMYGSSTGGIEDSHAELVSSRPPLAPAVVLSLVVT